MWISIYLISFKMHMQLFKFYKILQTFFDISI